VDVEKRVSAAGGQNLSTKLKKQKTKGGAVFFNLWERVCEPSN
jgi:hypothetical protein